jgi:hypothetical protein
VSEAVASSAVELLEIKGSACTAEGVMALDASRSPSSLLTSL